MTKRAVVVYYRFRGPVYVGPSATDINVAEAQERFKATPRKDLNRTIRFN